MIVADCSPAFPKLSDTLQKRLIELYRKQDEAQTDKEWNLLNYLVRRAWRPLHRQLRNEYIKLWGPKASFSHFFPQHTFNSIARQARAKM